MSVTEWPLRPAADWVTKWSEYLIQTHAWPYWYTVQNLIGQFQWYQLYLFSIAVKKILPQSTIKQYEFILSQFLCIRNLSMTNLGPLSWIFRAAISMSNGLFFFLDLRLSYKLTWLLLSVAGLGTLFSCWLSAEDPSRCLKAIHIALQFDSLSDSLIAWQLTSSSPVGEFLTLVC